MRSFIKRALIVSRDRIRYARLIQYLTGIFFHVRGRIARDLSIKLHHFAKAFRLLVPLGRDRSVRQDLAPYVTDADRVGVWREHRIGWPKRKLGEDQFEISKGLLLKPYVGPNEKGVLLISFEYNWLPLLALAQARELFKRYALICAPSWSPPPFPSIWSMASVPGADVFVMQSNFSEAAWYDRLPTHVTALPLLISHWIHPDYYRPLPHEERDIDILMVANWAAFKRHWVLFKALRGMSGKYRVELVGQPDSGRTMADIESEARAYGVRDQVTIRERLSIEEVTSLQCRSKTSLVFSQREGSCVVVAESMFADCPVGLLQGAHIGSSAFVNSDTGAFLNERRLAEELECFVDRSAEYSPRAWAVENISCFRSAERLNRTLRQTSEKRGGDCSLDIQPFMCRPNPVYVDTDASTKMAPHYQELLNRTGVSIRGFD